MSRNNNLSGGLFTGLFDKPKPSALTIKETPLSAMIAAYLDNRGVYNDRLNSGQVTTKQGNYLYLCKSGTPDRFAILRGQIIFIEVKMFGKKPSESQKIRHDELCQSGAIVLVCDSYDNFIGKFTAIRAALECLPRKDNLYE